VIVTLAHDVGDMFVETQCRIKRHTEQFDSVLELNVSTSDVNFLGSALPAAGPVLWNSLPSHLKEADLPYSQLRRLDSGAMAQCELF